MMFKTFKEEEEFVTKATNHWRDMLFEKTAQYKTSYDIEDDKTAFAFAQVALMNINGVPVDLYTKTFEKYYDDSLSYPNNILKWMWNYLDGLYQDEVEEK